MSQTYHPSDQKGKTGPNGLLGLAVTIAIFTFLPAMHLLGKIGATPVSAEQVDPTIQPPPPPPEDPPPPPEKKEEQEEPEMEEPPPEMTLTQLELALNPGMGGATGDFGFDAFNTGGALADLEIFELKDLDQSPQPEFQVNPIYPYDLKQAGVAGSVVVEFVILPDGSVRGARAVRSSHREFERPAIDSIMRSQWKPGRKDGKAVATRVRQEIRFNP